MQFHLLAEPRFYPIPKGIIVMDDYGKISVRMQDGSTKSGNHIFVHTNEECLKEWLGSYDGFLKGKGHVMMQEFEVVHLKLNK